MTNNKIYAFQKFGINKICFCFFKEDSSAHQSCIYVIKNTEKIAIIWNITSFLF